MTSEADASFDGASPVSCDSMQTRSASRIVMVDDEPTTIEVIQMFLQGEGYEDLVPVTDATRALDVMSEVQPDLVLLDWMMPGMSGLEVLRGMRRIDSLMHVPVVVLTSSTDSQTKLQALEYGATDFLAKPVDPSELALRLRNTLAAKAHQDRLAFYDTLTALPNRRLLMDRLGEVLRRTRRDAGSCAILRIDLDRFRQINDTLGQGVGDALLRAVADRLSKSVQGEGMTLARVAGDEFMLLLPEAQSAETPAELASQVLHDLAEAFWIGGQELYVSGSIGVARSPDDGTDVESLVARSGTALAQAKRAGGNAIEYSCSALNARSAERLVLENALRRALGLGEFSLVYQPKVELRSGRIVGAEALMRWNSAEFGNVPPDRFIHVAEEIGTIDAMGRWAIHEACRQLRRWRDQGLGGLRVAVNLSSCQFGREDIASVVREALAENAIEPRCLMLELTEGAIMEDPARASEILRTIKEMNVGISVDDFGTGYSSLSHLKRFPLDELKIDRSFMKGVPADSDDTAIVTAIVAMARSLGLSVVAEGVENREQLDFLRERGCEQYQGYLCSRPVPPDQWSEILAAWKG